MGEKKQFRSEAARRNYEKTEKQRAQAIRRKEFRAKKADLTAKAKAWLEENPRLAIAGTAALVVLILLVWLACKWFVGPGGSIPNFFGHLVGAQEDWLIIDTAENGDTPRYQHLADFAIPEGYQRGEFSAFADELQQDFYCSAVESGGAIGNFYISGAKNMTGAAMLEALLSYQVHQEAIGPKAAVIAGKDVNYAYLTFDESDTSGEGRGYSSLCIYVDTDKGACVTAMLNSPTLPMAEVPDEAALLAEAEIILSGLTIVK